MLLMADRLRSRYAQIRGLMVGDCCLETFWKVYDEIRGIEVEKVEMVAHWYATGMWLAFYVIPEHRRSSSNGRTILAERFFARSGNGWRCSRGSHVPCRVRG